MPRYRVMLCRDVTQWCEVEVEASSESEAEDKALELNPNSHDWEISEGSGDDPHINGAEEV